MLCLAAYALCVLCFCQISTDLPLSNDIPHLVKQLTMPITLFYPDSMLCTLAVEDLNDTRLSMRSCAYKDTTDTICSNPGPWMGSCRWLNEGLGLKQAIVGFHANRMGRYWGHWHVEDSAGAGVKVPYDITILLEDAMDTFLRDTAVWAPPLPGDSGYIIFDHNNNKWKFSFPAVTGPDSLSPASTDLHTRFRVAGDLQTSMRFQLRDDMTSGFEVSFYLSTSPNAGPWEGDKTGFFITGNAGEIHFTSSSIEYQTYSMDVERRVSNLAGQLVISRKSDIMNYTYVPGDPGSPPVSMNSLTFPADTALFIHLGMKVDDRLHIRHCLFSDFEILKGELRF